MQVGLSGSHPAHDPRQEYLDMYEGRDQPEVIPPDPEAYPEALQGLRDPTPEQSRRQRSHYYANVTMIDR